MSESESTFDLWVVHEFPERHLAYGANFCSCATCEFVLGEAGRRRPHLPIGIKFGLAPRIVVDAGVLLADGCGAGDLVRRFGLDGDWVREVWVAAAPDDAMSPGEARLLAVLADNDLPLPQWNVELTDDGAVQPAAVRRAAFGAASGEPGQKVKTRRAEE